jgi:hypothetical protein
MDSSRSRKGPRHEARGPDVARYTFRYARRLFPGLQRVVKAYTRRSKLQVTGWKRRLQNA